MQEQQLILTADIGGTNTYVTIFLLDLENKTKPDNLKLNNLKPNNLNLKLINEFNFKTKEINDMINFTAIIKKKCNQKQFSAVVIAAAGLINYKSQTVKLTNKNILFEAKQLKIILNADKIFLLNDFEALGYSINAYSINQSLGSKNNKSIIKINNKSIIKIKKGRQLFNKPIALLGAGTGFGKSILTYNKQIDSYIPLASEGGHSDFPIQNYFELQLSDFIKQQKKEQLLSYEDILSGNGLVNIYYFLFVKYKYIMKPKQLLIKIEIDNSEEKPAVIAYYKDTDFLCKETFKLFSKYYAIAIRNFALETLPFSGIYIAGGIAQKNKDIFNNYFIKIFETHDIHSELLKKIPIFLITNHYAGSYGCAFYYYLHYYKTKKS